MAVTNSSVPCSEETRDKIRSLKRGGETYDDLLGKMAEVYEREELETATV